MHDMNHENYQTSTVLKGMIFYLQLGEPHQHPPVHPITESCCGFLFSCLSCSPVQPGPFGGAHGLLQALQGRQDCFYRSRCPC